MRYFNVFLTRKTGKGQAVAKYFQMEVGEEKDEHAEIRNAVRETYPGWNIGGYVPVKSKVETTVEEVKPWDKSCSYRLSFVYTVKVLDTYISLLDKREEVEDLHGEVARIVFGLESRDKVTYHQRSWVKSTLYAVSYGMYGEELKTSFNKS